ncbi:MAG TPA: AMP-binding protein [Mycobacterium sp.]
MGPSTDVALVRCARSSIWAPPHPLTAGHPFDPAAAGYVIPPVQCRVVDDDGADVPAGEVGTILVKAPWTANGYWKTRPADDFGDWFDTKDRGKLTGGGELTVMGRRRGLPGRDRRARE